MVIYTKRKRERKNENNSNYFTNSNVFVSFIRNALEPLKQMWADAETKGEKAVAIFFGTWISVLMILFWVGWIVLIYGILSGEADFENATFGIFDTLGY